MRVILEQADLIKVLEKHFGEKFPPEMVKVRAEPFEVELIGIPLVEASSDTVTAPAPASDQATKQSVDRAERAARAARAAAAADGLDGKWRITPPDGEGEADAEVVRLRAERNVTTEPPPFSPDELDESPTAVLARAREFEEAERPTPSEEE